MCVCRKQRIITIKSTKFQKLSGFACFYNILLFSGEKTLSDFNAFHGIIIKSVFAFVGWIIWFYFHRDPKPVSDPDLSTVFVAFVSMKVKKKQVVRSGTLFYPCFDSRWEQKKVRKIWLKLNDTKKKTENQMNS